jgi:DNA-binding CsgD family transcriptional regulator
MMKKHKQFFFVGDMIKMKILYTSDGCLQMTGIDSADLSPHHYFEFLHESEYERFSSARTTFFKLSQDLYKAERGESLLSLTLKMHQRDGSYIKVLYQHLFFYQEIPCKTVYVFQVHTNIDRIRKIKNGFHYYVGEDMSMFRFPDEKMLNQGNIFSAREFEIIKLVGLGLTSLQIGDKLFLSPHTVNKHRRNILKKSGMSHVSDLIFRLKEQGLL